MTAKEPTRRTFLETSTLATASLLGASNARAESARPNLVFIMADDLGYGDIGCYACPDIKTPNVDGLAREGVRLTDYYAAAPVCTPTRCALMTGRYQQRVRNLEWAIYPVVKTVGLSPSETTIATLLRNAGYETALYGKWHLGYRNEWAPNQHGFDEFFGLLSGNIDYFHHIEYDGTPDLYENTTPATSEGYMTDLITERAVEFIGRDRTKPFFLYVPYNAPHWPIQGPNDGGPEPAKAPWHEIGDRETYVDMVERMDEGIGQILDALRRKGLEENTLVVFCSDNGGDTWSRNAPFSGMKGHLREGGIRVPCAIRWPGKLPAGRTVNHPTITMDLSATLLACAGVAPTRELDGFDLLPILRGEESMPERALFWRNGFHGEKAVRQGPWKWLQEGEEDFLFNLTGDMAETMNLAAERPEQARELRSLFEAWENEMAPAQTVFGFDMNHLEPEAP